MDYVTVEEAAELAGVSVATIRRRCKTGALSATKAGTQWLIERNDVKRGSGRKRAPKGLSATYDLERSWTFVQSTDLPEAWVPDVLRFRDYIESTADLIDRANNRLTTLEFDAAFKVDIPKSTASNRPGVLLSIVDRICYQAVVSSFASNIDSRIGENVFSSRLAPSGKYFMERGTIRWVKFHNSVLEAADEGLGQWVGQTDISSYFEHIHHNILFDDLVSIGISGPPLKALRVMLSRWATVEGVGLPQGPNASRMLGNFYLSRVDEEMATLGHGYYRYMDDVRIIAKSKQQTVAAIRDFEHLCRQRGLICSTSKTTVLEVEAYRSADDGRDRAIANYFFEANNLKRARPVLKRILSSALKDEKIVQRDIKFSLWRLTRIREHTSLRRILDRLEDLAPVASVVAAYLKHFIGRKSIQDRIAKFLEDRERSYSEFLRSWLYAAMLECGKPPASFIALAKSDTQNHNNPNYLRAVSACVMARGCASGDIHWLKAQFDTEHDPTVLRAYLVALAYAGALDKSTGRRAVSRFPHLQSTVSWVQGRKELPSLLFANRHIAIKKIWQPALAAHSLMQRRLFFSLLPHTGCPQRREGVSRVGGCPSA
ncbi:reverse transcriptase domain-containing protein [Nocardia sp. NPDC020380]|uniref:reverse transcriptase domain-containing protein n=1 Tax=Nocardia sp. NPDC020380 TaxID=3364309 RepID=UPI0037BC7B3B